MRNKLLLVIGATTVATAVVALIAVWSLSVGAVPVSPAAIARYISAGSDGSPQAAILLQVRLPRVLLGLAVGCALSLSGVLLQGMFRNPLVEPYTLGLSGGAALAVCLNIIIRGRQAGRVISVPLYGFLGAAIVGALLYGLSRRQGRLSLHTMLLFGVMLSFMCSAGVMLLMALMRVEDLHGILFWTMGSLDQPNAGLVAIMGAVAAVGSIAAWLCAKSLNAFALGEEAARHLGVNPEQVKKYTFLLAALLTGASVAVAGIIGFVGLAVPHVIRRCVGSDHRVVLPLSAVAGAGFLLLCDTAARTLIAPLELPVGVISGLAGGSIFMLLLFKRRQDNTW